MSWIARQKFLNSGLGNPGRFGLSTANPQLCVLIRSFVREVIEEDRAIFVYHIDLIPVDTTPRPQISGRATTADTSYFRIQSVHYLLPSRVCDALS